MACRKVCRAARSIPVQPLFVEQCGNTQPRFVDRPLLDRIHERDGVLLIAKWRRKRIAAADEIVRAGEVADTVREELLRFRGVEVARRGHHVAFLGPDA